MVRSCYCEIHTLRRRRLIPTADRPSSKSSNVDDSGTVVDAKVIFAAALKCRACAIILAHNHPSTNPQPSRADIELTNKLKKAGELLDLPILDHLIITPHGYYSFADEGRM